MAQPKPDAPEYPGDPSIQRVVLPTVSLNTAHDEDNHHYPFRNTHNSNLKVVTRIQPKKQLCYERSEFQCCTSRLNKAGCVMEYSAAACDAMQRPALFNAAFRY